MPIQTTLRDYMKIADGTKIQVKISGGSYTDIGVVTGDTNATLEYDEFQEESANAGKSNLYVKNPTISGAFTLQNLNHENIANLASGLMTQVDTAASAGRHLHGPETWRVVVVHHPAQPNRVVRNQRGYAQTENGERPILRNC